MRERVGPENIHTPPKGGFLAYPSGNSILVPYLPLKNWALVTPLPFEIPINLQVPGGAY